MLPVIAVDVLSIINDLIEFLANGIESRIVGNSDAPHGPEELLDLPMRFLSVMSQSGDSQR